MGISGDLGNGERVPEVEAEPCITCPHCDERVLLNEATWRTRNNFGDNVQGEIVCPKCGGRVVVETSLPG